MATGVVLYHRSQGQQAEDAARLLPGPPTTADIMGQQRVRLGAVQGRTPIAGPDLRSPREGDQSGRSDADYADSASSALQTSPPPPVGDQSGGTTSSPTLYGYKTCGDVQIVLRITRSVSGLDQGCWPKPAIAWILK